MIGPFLGKAIAQCAKTLCGHSDTVPQRIEQIGFIKMLGWVCVI